MRAVVFDPARTCTTCSRIWTSAGVRRSMPSAASRCLAVDPFMSTVAKAITAMKNTQWAWRVVVFG
jgi:hypothetical protein